MADLTRSPDLAALDRIMTALQHAEHKHPGWPNDPLRRAVIIVEEAGEVLQATLNMIEEREKITGNYPWQHTLNKVLDEVAQTGAMALRYLINYERERYAKSHTAGQSDSDQASR